MELLYKFNAYIKKENLFHPKDKLILAVSGGVDSVVMCALCNLSGYNFSIAHCNFRLRGEESERDEKFVRELANDYGVEFYLKMFETQKLAEENKIGIQEAARKLRYEWFYELVEGSGSPANCRILTAHHANDNIETLLMNFLKGTGINGLQGIAPRQAHIVRPFLFAKKAELIAFAKENNLLFVEDSSNVLDKYTRNYVRNKIIPAIQNVFPQVEENLLNNIQRFTEIRQVYDASMKEKQEKLVTVKGNEEQIPILKLKKTFPFRSLLWEIIRKRSFSSGQLDEVVKLMDADNGSYITSEFYRIIKNRKWLIITPKKADELTDTIIVDKNHKTVKYASGKLKVERPAIENCTLSNNSSVAFLDADKITFPLLLRKWKQGDYFYPLGMNKKKKLSKFFIDQKMSLTEKENIWVLETNQRIIWVIGKRIDDRFKITPQTKKILKISQS